MSISESEIAIEIELVEKINNISLSNKNFIRESIMATIQSQEFTQLLNALPEYGPNDDLQIFIESVQDLLTFVHDKLSPVQTHILGCTIKTKIKGEARKFLSLHNATEWAQVKEILLKQYGDHRNEDILSFTLQNTIQNYNENYHDFYKRILFIRNDLLQYLKVHERTPEIYQFKYKMYMQKSVKTFLVGILEPYNSYLNHFECETLEDAYTKCQAYDNHNQELKWANHARQNNKQQVRQTKPQFPSRPIPITTRNPYNPNVPMTNQPINQRPSFNYMTQPSTSTGFPGDINKPLPQRTYPPTNKQTFGKPMPTSQPKPTPMSISTKISHPRPSFQQNFQQTQFPSQSRPTFKSSELFNNELEETETPLENENEYFDDYPENEQDDTNFIDPASDQLLT